MKYCIYCDYEVKTSWEFNKHLSTAKHITNIENFNNYQNKLKLHCPFCNKIFDTENNKINHYNVCEKNEQNVLVTKIKNENNNLKKKNKVLKNKNTTLTNSNKILKLKIKNLINSNIEQIANLSKEHINYIEKINNDHVNHIEDLKNDHTLHVEELYQTANKTLETIAKLAITEIRQKYPNAPLLERMNNEIVNQIMNDVFRKGDDDYKMCSRIIFFYKDKQLVNLISDAILSYYKKLDPKDQAFWNTDTARLNYIIKDIVDDKDSWVIDKFGVKMKNLVISPLGEELRQYIFEHKNVLCKNIIDRNNTRQTIQKMQEDINVCFDIIFYVDEKKFEYNICKTMAPKMYYNNNVSTRTIQNS
jgi:hypothetical protein